MPPQPQPTSSSGDGKPGAAGETKGRAAQLFFDIFAADPRLQSAGDRAAITGLVDACITYDVLNNKTVFQGAQLFDTLAGRRVSQEALVQALLVLEQRLGRINVVLRQPDVVRQLLPPQRADLLKKAPPSRSEYLDALEKAAVPTVIREARENKRRNKTLIMAAAAVTAVAAIVVLVTSLPKVTLKPAQLAFPPNAVPCTTERTANTFLFCVVDVQQLAAEDDGQIRARMKVSQAVAKQAGYREVEFLKPGTEADGEQHRYKPLLWMRDPELGGAVPPSPAPPPK